MTALITVTACGHHQPPPVKGGWFFQGSPCDSSLSNTDRTSSDMLEKDRREAEGIFLSGQKRWACLVKSLENGERLIHKHSWMKVLKVNWMWCIEEDYVSLCDTANSNVLFHMDYQFFPVRSTNSFTYFCCVIMTHSLYTGTLKWPGIWFNSYVLISIPHKWHIPAPWNTEQRH